ncbi:MAG: hypothetical protein U0Q15_19945 [Kineosporiaceae bacterium]
MPPRQPSRPDPGDAAPVGLDELTGEVGVLTLYRQVFAVLARESGAMIVDPETLDVDEAILEVFAEAGSEGLTLEQVVAQCPGHRSGMVARRFEVLRAYGAIARVVDRAHERYHRAAFAPYVMLLFLRRVAEQGGQAELHHLLTLEGQHVRDPGAGADDGRTSVRRLTQVFRLLAHQIAGLTIAAPVADLRENAQLLWGNRELIRQAEDVHGAVLSRWPDLDRECAWLRAALAGYGDASDAAAARLIEQAGSTRALGLLPAETWRTFARTADVDRLASVLDGFLFDAPAPYLPAHALAEAVDSARLTGPARTPPPRAQAEEAPPERADADDATELRAALEAALAGRDAVDVESLLGEAGDWAGARRLLAAVTAAHHHPDLEARLSWGDGLVVDLDGAPSWSSRGSLTASAPAPAPAARRRRRPDGEGAQ